MNYISILAVAGEEVITSEDFDAPSYTETTTVQDGSATAPPQDAPAAKPNALFQFAPLVIIMVAMYFLVLRGPKKKQQKHQKMVQSLQKNDRVRTIGGILGTVLEVKDDHIVLKVDESNNTKLKISPTAIGTVVSDDKE
jgi:preprotein translocase subunit YajC